MKVRNQLVMKTRNNGGGARIIRASLSESLCDVKERMVEEYFPEGENGMLMLSTDYDFSLADGDRQLIPVEHEDFSMAQYQRMHCSATRLRIYLVAVPRVSQSIPAMQGHLMLSYFVLC